MIDGSFCSHIFESIRKEWSAIKKQILVIEQDPSICHAMKSHLQDSDTEVFCISKTAEALKRFINQEYCLVIMAYHQPEMDGIKMLHAMKAVKNTPVLVLTEQIEAPEKIALFQAGANACIEKPVDISVCAAQAKALIQIYIDSGSYLENCVPLIYGTELLIDPMNRRVLINGSSVRLTKTEFDLFFCLARCPGQLWSREQLYRHIWDEDPASDGENTVRTHLGNLRKKLTAAGKNYIENTRGVGYRFEPPDTITEK